MQAVIDLVGSHDKSFSQDPRGGPWGQSIRASEAFSKSYSLLECEQYIATVTSMYCGLIDRDTAPGAEPEDLIELKIPTLIVPGNDNFHATSAARYLHECLNGSEYWDMPADDQTEENTPTRLLKFLDDVAN